MEESNLAENGVDGGANWRRDDDPGDKQLAIPCLLSFH